MNTSKTVGPASVRAILCCARKRLPLQPTAINFRKGNRQRERDTLYSHTRLMQVPGYPWQVPENIDIEVGRQERVVVKTC